MRESTCYSTVAELGGSMRFLLAGLLASVMAAATVGVARAEWQEAKSDHFIIFGDTNAGDLKAYAERLERFDQAGRKLRGMADPPLTDAQRLTIFALKDEDAVGRLAKSDSILGFYTTGAEGAYAFVPRQEGYYAQRAEMSAETIFFHEYAHHLQLSSTSAALPAWVVEGFAEFFATAELMDNGSIQVGKPPMWRQWWVQRYDGFPITEMLGGTLRNMTGRDVASLYGRGWLLTHYLTFEQSRRGQLKQYVEAIQHGTEPLQAAKSSFGDDLRSLDRALDEYLRQRSVSTFVLPSSSISPGPVTVRALRPGEAAVIEPAIKLRRGMDRKEAAKLAGETRRSVAAYPSDPFAQLVHGQVEFKARNYPAAEAAGKLAVAADSNLRAAYVLVGKAKMEQARTNPDSADWKEIRSWFARANRIDPESAEPLMLFYRTYRYAGATPTANAVEGLLYAVELAPQDEMLRLEAVRQLTFDGKLAEARKVFTPAAFYPHSAPEWRERKAMILEAMTKLDRPTALSLLDEELEKRRKEEERD